MSIERCITSSTHLEAVSKRPPIQKKILPLVVVSGADTKDPLFEKVLTYLRDKKIPYNTTHETDSNVRVVVYPVKGIESVKRIKANVDRCAPTLLGRKFFILWWLPETHDPESEETGKLLPKYEALRFVPRRGKAGEHLIHAYSAEEVIAEIEKQHLVT